MVRCCRWILLWCVLLGAWPRLASASTESQAYRAALKAFQDGNYKVAEEWLGDFARLYPTSSRLSEAALFQAEARLQLKDYDGAVELLASHLARAGKRTDDYLRWLAEARFRQGRYEQAAEAFGKLVREFPASSWRLEGAVGEASARAQLRDWAQVVELLQRTNGVFQHAIHLPNQPTNTPESVLHGFLLLGEAYMAQTNLTAATGVLQDLRKLWMDPDTAWQRQFMVCRIAVAQGQLQQALVQTTNLLVLATSPTAQAESTAFQGQLFERMGRLEDAVAAYTRNLAKGFPVERQREALLKVTELSVALNRVSEAAQQLKVFLSGYPDAASADLAWLTLGELRLSESENSVEDEPDWGTETNSSSAATNTLQQAISAFCAVTNFANSPLLGKAELDLGWCYCLSNSLPEDRRLAEAQSVLQQAVRHLPVSADLAVAFFKLGDVQYQLRQYQQAIASYKQVAEERFQFLPEVRSNLVERALYQTVLAAVAAGRTDEATNALERIFKTFPNGYHTDKAVLGVGQAVSRKGKDGPQAAREIYQKFLASTTNAALLPEIGLAVARTYEQQGSWGQAIHEYDQWLERFGSSEIRPDAEYARGQANVKAGFYTNALICFTNFVAHFPTNKLTPFAQWWVADYYFQAHDYLNAENNYQLLSLNWPGGDLGQEAGMMAGRSALARQSPSDALGYFSAVWTNSTGELRSQALYALGDTYMTMGEVAQTQSNKLANYAQAIQAFELLSRSPTNVLGVLALGQKASALLQCASLPEDYDLAAKAFQQVLDAPLADARSRGLAKIGLAVIWEKRARFEKGAAQTRFLNQALNAYLEVFYNKNFLRPGEEADAFCTQKAGMEAARLYESRQQWELAIGIYKDLKNTLPPLGAHLDNRIRLAQKSQAQ